MIIVSLLFFVLSLVAAYTNRNLIFEQRTSANQYRSTQAFEAAEAGIEWALAQLNSGRITDSCEASTDAADSSFRQRYLSFGADGVVRPTGALAADGGSTVWPSCVFNGTEWSCSCPESGEPEVEAPTGSGVFPAFRVRFRTASTTQPGVVWVESNGCTRLDDNCLDFPARSTDGEGRSTLKVLVAMRGALASPPRQAVTVRGSLDIGSSALGAFNADATAGTYIRAGGAIIGSALRLGVPGVAVGPDALAATDPYLSSLPSAERFFTSTFATFPEVWKQQPAAILLECTTACSSDLIRATVALNPGRVIWAEGDVALDGGGEIGTAENPVMIVATGDVSVDVTLHGLIYSRSAAWTSGGTGEIRGAVIAEGDLAGSGAFSVIYDAAVLGRLRFEAGTFVRAPGGWRDF